MSDEVNSQARILVVDDETIVLSLVHDALEDEDYEVITTSRPDEALSMLAHQPFDLIISDIRMPYMSGIELVERARQIQPDVGVIFMTGYANLTSAKNAIKQGAFDYIMKPFELSEIRQAVHNAVKVRTEAAEKSSTQQLSHLSDLNRMLFTANDRDSLITSSLRFAMLHQHTKRGSILYWDQHKHECLMITGKDDQTETKTLPEGPIVDVVEQMCGEQIREPKTIGRNDQHPFFGIPSPELNLYLYPSWLGEGQYMSVVPVIRADKLTGWIMLGLGDDTARLTEADAKFLAITASQLAITLENLSLLEQTQEAYARLKGLQDETIELEKMATRGQMSAEIGHELNNFLGVVAGNLSLLDVNLRKGKTDELPRYVAAMTETIEKIKIFTSSLMDLTKISSKKERLAFDAVLSEVVDYLRPQRRFQGIEIKLLNLPRGLYFEADATQIQQLLYNLFNNAADATVDRPTRKITTNVERLNNRQFLFSITDTGCGFAPELLERAFQEKFTTKKSGHGFGLVVCKRIIDAHQGELHVDSTPGEGTTIRIYFPIATQTSEPVAAATV